MSDLASGLRNALEREFRDERDYDIRYFSAFADLNADGHKEAIAYVVGPRVCGTDGCTLYVFKPSQGRFVIVSKTPTSGLPVVALPDRHHGWRDLLVISSGGGGSTSKQRMRYDGQTYVESADGHPAAGESRQRLIGPMDDYMQGHPVFPKTTAGEKAGS